MKKKNETYHIAHSEFNLFETDVVFYDLKKAKDYAQFRHYTHVVKYVNNELDTDFECIITEIL
jgi:hypothetical protein